MLWLFRPSLEAWFQQDDFAWLGVARGVETWRDLLWALFTPTVHGTLRPLSERGFFILFRALFGLDTFPWRIWVFATQAGSLILLNAITRKLTGSAVAGFLAAALWAVHSRMVTALSWTSAYMQVLCGLCLLGAFWLWLRWVESGETRYRNRMWAVFLAGFLVMETNLMFPVLAAAHALFFAPRFLRKTIPMFVVSAAYLAAHMLLVPKQTAGVYTIHFSPAILDSLRQYWSWTVSPVTVGGQSAVPAPWPEVLGVAGTALLAGFVLWSIWRRRWQAPLFALWYLILLAPVLPLTGHVVDYYVSLALIGFSMLAGDALACAFRAVGARPAWRWAFPAAGIALLVLFVAVSFSAARVASKWFRWRGIRTEMVVRGVLHARELHPKSTILLDGMDIDLFSSVMCDYAFRNFGLFDVLLTPGSGAGFPRRPDLCAPESFALPYEVVLNALDRNVAEVYSLPGSRLRNITSEYSPTPPAGDRKMIRLDLATEAAVGFLGPEWPETASELRWMPDRAAVRLPALAGSGRTLVLEVRPNGPEAHGAPPRLRVSVEGQPYPERRLDGGGEVRLEYPLADSLPQTGKLNLALELDPPAPRTLRLAFGAIEIRAP